MRFGDIPENIDENEIMREIKIFAKNEQSININIQTKSQYDSGENTDAEISYETFRRYLNSALEIIMSQRFENDVLSFEDMKKLHSDAIIVNAEEQIARIVLEKYNKDN